MQSGINWNAKAHAIWFHGRYLKRSFDLFSSTVRRGDLGHS
jgi:hypothetical protein